MQLLKISIKTFRGIGASTDENGEPKGVEVNFDSNEIIFLIGNNNVGKSAVLHAYDYFVTASKKAEADDFHGKSEDSPPIELEAWIQAETDEDREHQAVKTWLYGYNQRS